MDAGASAGPPAFGIARRIVLVVVGGAMVVLALTCMGVVIALATTGLVNGEGLGAEGVLVVGGVVLVFGGLTAMGAKRVAAGVRGRPAVGDAIGRGLDGWVRRNGYAGALASWGCLSVGALVHAGGLEPLLREPRFALHRGASAIFLGFLLLPVHVAVHEAGHALAGRLVGFRFRSLRVGWLAVLRDERGFRVVWERPPLAGLLGLHSGVPLGTVALGPRHAIHAAGGVGATWLAALACRWASGRHAPDDGLLAEALRAVARVGWWLGAWLGVSNLLPFKTRHGWATDGLRILDHLRPASPARDAVRRFQALSGQALRPRDWGLPPAFFLAALGGAVRERDELLLAAAAVALDTGATAVAAEALGRVAEAPATDPLLRRELELQLAMLDAFEGRPVAARERLDGLGPHPSMLGYQQLAEAVVLAAEGRHPEAREALAAWERALQATGAAAAVRVGNEWAMERLDDLLRAAGQPAVG